MSIILLFKRAVSGLDGSLSKHINYQLQCNVKNLEKKFRDWTVFYGVWGFVNEFWSYISTLYNLCFSITRLRNFGTQCSYNNHGQGHFSSDSSHLTLFAIVSYFLTFKSCYKTDTVTIPSRLCTYQAYSAVSANSVIRYLLSWNYQLLVVILHRPLLLFDWS